MDEIELNNLDIEFKRYLQILRPYLDQLINHDVIDICNAWIQRLSCCNDNEKPLRNKYVFSLCYQMARGFLDHPFVKVPPGDTLPPINDDLNSEDSSTEMECVVVDSEEPDTKVLFNNKKQISSDTEYLSQNEEYEDKKEISGNLVSGNKTMNPEDNRPDVNTHKQNVLCYTCPEMFLPYQNLEHSDERYENRAKGLIRKLREIKAQNTVLQNELITLKGNSRKSIYLSEDRSTLKLDIATSAYVNGNDSNVTLKSLNCKVHKLEDARNNLIETIANLQDKIDHFEEMKKHEINGIEANHKLEIIKIKTSVREEVKDTYEKKIEEMKQNYEVAIKELEEKYRVEITNLTVNKDNIIVTKDNDIKEKTVELSRLETQLEEQKNKFNVVLSKFLENSGGDIRNDSFKYKYDQLEKRLLKMENSKAKCVRAYENRIACLQREKHFIECSLHLQLARQRAQVVNEITDENQTELTGAVDKLEAKYKEIVANVQATAIQRRMQDQIALESILQAATGNQNEGSSGTNNQFSVKPAHNQSCDNEITSLYAANKDGSKLTGEGSFMTGYCLNGERLGQLFDRAYIPQRENVEPSK